MSVAHMPMPKPLPPRVASLAAAALLGAAAAFCGTAAVLLVAVAAQGGRVEAPAAPELAAMIHAGVETDGVRLTRVVPGGPAWTAGLRPGWLVDPSLTDLEGAVGACSDTRECALYHDSQVVGAVAGQWVFETIAALLLVAGFVTWHRRPRLAGLLAASAIAVTAPSYALLGQVPLFPTLYAAALLLPPVWLRSTGAHQAWNVVLIVALLLGITWAIAWLAVPSIYDLAEVARMIAIVLTVAFGIAVVSGWIAIDDVPIGGHRAVDAAVAITLLAWALASWRFGIVPDWVAAGLAGMVLAAYIALRRRLRSLLTRLTYAELGQRATMQELEDERSRVARDLHDVPLQELTAVIHRLDKRPDAASEVERLREIAGHLRAVSVSLRPPVLDDVGLGAAIAELAERQSVDEGTPVRINVDDQTSIDPSSRAPAEVELAVFRIVHEALTNAQRHARASAIDVTGVIARDRLSITVADDGRGIDESSVLLAQRAGRLGLASMRERAAAIGASLSVAQAIGGRGASISVAWSDQ